MYRVHYTLPDGSEDSIVLSGSSIKAIQKKADSEIAKRGGTNPWSEKVE